MLQRYYLRILIGFVAVSCGSDYDNLTAKERKELSREIWLKENGKHGFNGHFQGTPIGMTLLDKIIQLDTTNCDALRELSVPYLKRGIPYEWKPIMDRAVACNPKIWQPHRGYLYLWFYRDYKKAIQDFDASDTLTPNFVDAPQGHSVDYWRGISYLGLQDYEGAKKYFKQHIETVTKESGEDWVEPNTFLYLGITHFENDNLEAAEINIDKMLKYTNNNSADGHYYKSKILMSRGSYKDASKYVDWAIDNYNLGYFNKRDYVEEIRQVYPQQLDSLKEAIVAKISAEQIRP